MVSSLLINPDQHTDDDHFDEAVIRLFDPMLRADQVLEVFYDQASYRLMLLTYRLLSELTETL